MLLESVNRNRKSPMPGEFICGKRTQQLLQQLLQRWLDRLCYICMSSFFPLKTENVLKMTVQVDRSRRETTIIKTTALISWISFMRPKLAAPSSSFPSPPRPLPVMSPKSEKLPNCAVALLATLDRLPMAWERCPDVMWSSCSMAAGSELLSRVLPPFSWTSSFCACVAVGSGYVIRHRGMTLTRYNSFKFTCMRASISYLCVHVYIYIQILIQLRMHYFHQENLHTYIHTYTCKHMLTQIHTYQRKNISTIPTYALIRQYVYIGKEETSG